jgi:2-polyprenyl-3-methyl-5-hydroxy-6-metoxy-1,4-benzoquinol methylase
LVSRLLQRSRERTDPFAQFSALSDPEWLAILVRSLDEPVIDGVRMPGFPNEGVQRSTVGSSGAQPLQEVFNFFSAVKRYGDQLGRPLQTDAHVLDFGCGWGRILRFFLKDCGPANLWGIDVDPELVGICRTTMNCATFDAIDPLPPTAFQDESFDVVVAYSVFSHLAEHASIAWVKEITRLLRPNGMMVVTTEAREFIELCRSLRGREHEFGWHKALANSFVDTEAAYRAYDAGEFLYAPTGGGSYRPADFYGEALIPEDYVRTRWTKYLQFIDFVSDPRVLPQALIVMQKS